MDDDAGGGDAGGAAVEVEPSNGAAEGGVDLVAAVQPLVGDGARPSVARVEHRAERDRRDEPIRNKVLFNAADDGVDVRHALAIVREAVRRVDARAELRLRLVLKDLLARPRPIIRITEVTQRRHEGLLRLGQVFHRHLKAIGSVQCVSPRVEDCVVALQLRLKVERARGRDVQLVAAKEGAVDHAALDHTFADALGLDLLVGQRELFVDVFDEVRRLLRPPRRAPALALVPALQRRFLRHEAGFGDALAGAFDNVWAVLVLIDNMEQSFEASNVPYLPRRLAVRAAVAV